MMPSRVTLLLCILSFVIVPSIFGVASLGDAAAIPYLKAAIAREKEEAIRSCSS
jgi:hypothetical protein